MATFTFPLLDQWEQGGDENSPFLNAGTGENDVPATGGITHNWANPDRVTSQFMSTTSDLSTSGGGTYVLPYLRASNFGFSIPVGATVVGLEVEIVWGASNSGLTEDEIRLAWGASAANLSTNNNGDAGSIPSTDQTVETKGGPTDLWGELSSTLTPAVINSSDFGWVLKVGRADTGATSRTARVDCMRMRVYYTVPEPLAGAVRISQTEVLALVTEAKPARITQVYAEVIAGLTVPVTIPTGRRQVVVAT